MQSEIKQWGNSAAIRLSRSILAQVGLDIASPVEIEVKEGRIIIQAMSNPVPRLALPYSEVDLLQGLTPHTAHADEAAGPSASELDY
jgi:antitoxin MazE